MNPASRIACALVLLLAVGCGPDSAASGGAGGHDHSGHDHNALGHSHVSPVERSGDGRSPSAAGYTLADLDFPDAPGKGTLSFRILGVDDKPHTRFLVEQTKLMHVYVVRTDLADFDHAHPDLAEDGTWTSPLIIEREGIYQVVAEFVAVGPGSGRDHVVVGDEITVGGQHQPEPLPGTDSAAAAGGYELHLFGDLAPGEPSIFKIHFTHDGNEVTGLRPYLEAYAHLTGFRAKDLTTVHLHPQQPAPPGSEGGPTLAFHAEFAKPGTYRLFIQFRPTERYIPCPPPSMSVDRRAAAT